MHQFGFRRGGGCFRRIEGSLQDVEYLIDSLNALAMVSRSAMRSVMTCPYELTLIPYQVNYTSVFAADILIYFG